MTKVHITNFQSIADTEFVIDGFTVIVGKNNIGKSAIIRAIDAALTNQAGKEFIRNGTKKSEVSINREGLDISWKKGDTSFYKINGEDYSKLNRAVPQPILDAGFKKIEVGDRKLNPLAAPQFEPLFLVNESGSVITEAVSKVYKLHIISNADDLCQKDLRAKKGLLKLRESDLEITKDRLIKFEGFEEIKKSIKDLYSLREKCEKTQALINDVNRFQQKMIEIQQGVDRLKIIEKIKIPDCLSCKKKIEEFQWILLKHSNLVLFLQDMKKLQNVKDINMPNSLNLKSKIEDFRQTKTWHSQLKNTAQDFKKYSDLLEEMGKLDNLANQTNKLKGAIENLQYISKNHITLKNSVQEFKNIQTELSGITTDIDKLTMEIKQYKVCPLCKKSI